MKFNRIIALFFIYLMIASPLALGEHTPEHTDVTNQPQDAFSDKSPQDQAQFLANNYDPVLAAEFYSDPANVGINAEVDGKYFGDPTNIGKNPPADDKFFSGGYQGQKTELRDFFIESDAHKEAGSEYFKQFAPITLDIIDKDFKYNAVLGTLTNGDTITLSQFGNDPNVKDVISVDGGFRVIKEKDGQTQTVEFKGDEKREVIYDSDSGEYEFKDSEGKIQSFNIPADSKVTFQFDQDKLTVEGAASGDYAIDGDVAHFNNRDGALVIEKNGDMSAENAEVSTSSIFIDGFFDKKGDTIEAWADNGEQTVIIDKTACLDPSSCVGVSTRGQSKGKSTLTVHLNEVSPQSQFAKFLNKKPGTDGQQQKTQDEFRQRAQELKKPCSFREGCEVLDGKDAEVFIKRDSKTGVINLYGQGRFEGGIYDTATGKKGILPNRLRYVGKNGNSELDVEFRTAVNNINIRGEGKLTLEGYTEGIENNQAGATFKITQNPSSKDNEEIIRADCISCKKGNAITIKKTVAIATGQQGQAFSQGEVSSLRLKVDVDADGEVLFRPSSEDLGILASGKTRDLLEDDPDKQVIIFNDLFMEVPCGEEVCGFRLNRDEEGELGAGYWEINKKTSVGKNVDYVLEVKKALGNEIILANDQNVDSYNKVLTSLDEGKLNELNGLKFDKTDPGYEALRKQILQKEGIDISKLEDQSYFSGLSRRVDSFQKAVQEMEALEIRLGPDGRGLTPDDQKRINDILKQRGGGDFDKLTRAQLTLARLKAEEIADELKSCAGTTHCTVTEKDLKDAKKEAAGIQQQRVSAWNKWKLAVAKAELAEKLKEVAKRQKEPGKGVPKEVAAFVTKTGVKLKKAKQDQVTKANAVKQGKANKAEQVKALKAFIESKFSRYEIQTVNLDKLDNENERKRLLSNWAEDYPDLVEFNKDITHIEIAVATANSDKIAAEINEKDARRVLGQVAEDFLRKGQDDVAARVYSLGNDEESAILISEKSPLITGKIKGDLVAEYSAKAASDSFDEVKFLADNGRIREATEMKKRILEKNPEYAELAKDKIFSANKAITGNSAARNRQDAREKQVEIDKLQAKRYERKFGTRQRAVDAVNNWGGGVDLSWTGAGNFIDRSLEVVSTTAADMMTGLENSGSYVLGHTFGDQSLNDAKGQLESNAERSLVRQRDELNNLANVVEAHGRLGFTAEEAYANARTGNIPTSIQAEVSVGNQLVVPPEAKLVELELNGADTDISPQAATAEIKQLNKDIDRYEGHPDREAWKKRVSQLEDIKEAKVQKLVVIAENIEAVNYNTFAFAESQWREVVAADPDSAGAKLTQDRIDDLDSNVLTEVYGEFAGGVLAAGGIELSEKTFITVVRDPVISTVDPTIVFDIVSGAGLVLKAGKAVTKGTRLAKASGKAVKYGKALIYGSENSIKAVKAANKVLKLADSSADVQKAREGLKAALKARKAAIGTENLGQATFDLVAAEKALKNVENTAGVTKARNDLVFAEAALEAEVKAGQALQDSVSVLNSKGFAGDLAKSKNKELGNIAKKTAERNDLVRQADSHLETINSVTDTFRASDRSIAQSRLQETQEAIQAADQVIIDATARVKDLDDLRNAASKAGTTSSRLWGKTFGKTVGLGDISIRDGIYLGGVGDEVRAAEKAYDATRVDFVNAKKNVDLLGKSEDAAKSRLRLERARDQLEQASAGVGQAYANRRSELAKSAIKSRYAQSLVGATDETIAAVRSDDPTVFPTAEVPDEFTRYSQLEKELLNSGAEFKSDSDGTLKLVTSNPTLQSKVDEANTFLDGIQGSDDIYIDQLFADTLAKAFSESALAKADNAREAARKVDVPPQRAEVPEDSLFGVDLHPCVVGGAIVGLAHCGPDDLVTGVVSPQARRGETSTSAEIPPEDVRPADWRDVNLVSRDTTPRTNLPTRDAKALRKSDLYETEGGEGILLRVNEEGRIGIAERLGVDPETLPKNLLIKVKNIEDPELAKIANSYPDSAKILDDLNKDGFGPRIIDSGENFYVVEELPGEDLFGYYIRQDPVLNARYKDVSNRIKTIKEEISAAEKAEDKILLGKLEDDLKLLRAERDNEIIPQAIKQIDQEAFGERYDELVEELVKRRILVADIGPGNLWVSPGGLKEGEKLKLIDAGLAIPLDDEAKLRRFYAQRKAQILDGESGVQLSQRQADAIASSRRGAPDSSDRISDVFVKEPVVSEVRVKIPEEEVVPSVSPTSQAAIDEIDELKALHKEEETDLALVSEDFPDAKFVQTNPEDVTISGRLGEGTVGVVYEGRIKGVANDQELALKTARKDPLRGELIDNVESLFEELQNAEGFEDVPGICKFILCNEYHGVYEIDGVPYLASKKLEAKPLFDLTPDEMIKWDIDGKLKDFNGQMEDAIEAGWVPDDVQGLVLTEPQVIRGVEYPAGTVVPSDLDLWRYEGVESPCVIPNIRGGAIFPGAIIGSACNFGLDIDELETVPRTVRIQTDPIPLEERVINRVSGVRTRSDSYVDPDNLRVGDMVPDGKGWNDQIDIVKRNENNYGLPETDVTRLADKLDESYVGNTNDYIGKGIEGIVRKVPEDVRKALGFEKPSVIKVRNYQPLSAEDAARGLSPLENSVNSFSEVAEFSNRLAKKGLAPEVYLHGENYYVAELLEGETVHQFMLRNLRREDRLRYNLAKSEDKVAILLESIPRIPDKAKKQLDGLITELTDGLSELGVVVDDLHPGNVILVNTPEGLKAKVVDVGLAYDTHPRAAREINLHKKDLILRGEGYKAEADLVSIRQTQRQGRADALEFAENFPLEAEEIINTNADDLEGILRSMNVREDARAYILNNDAQRLQRFSEISAGSEVDLLDLSRTLDAEVPKHLGDDLWVVRGKTHYNDAGVWKEKREGFFSFLPDKKADVQLNQRLDGASLQIGGGIPEDLGDGVWQVRSKKYHKVNGVWKEQSDSFFRRIFGEKNADFPTAQKLEGSGLEAKLADDIQPCKIGGFVGGAIAGPCRTPPVTSLLDESRQGKHFRIKSKSGNFYEGKYVRQGVNSKGETVIVYQTGEKKKGLFSFFQKNEEGTLVVDRLDENSLILEGSHVRVRSKDGVFTVSGVYQGETKSAFLIDGKGFSKDNLNFDTVLQEGQEIEMVSKSGNHYSGIYKAEDDQIITLIDDTGEEVYLGRDRLDLDTIRPLNRDSNLVDEISLKEFNQNNQKLFDNEEFISHEGGKNYRKEFVFEGESESRRVVYSLEDRQIAESAGIIFENVPGKKIPPGQYTFVILEDGTVVLGKISNDLEFGVKHFHLANGRPVQVAGEVVIDNAGNYIFNLQSGTYTNPIKGRKNLQYINELKKSGQVDESLIKFEASRKVDEFEDKLKLNVEDIFKRYFEKEGGFTKRPLLQPKKPSLDELVDICVSNSKLPVCGQFPDVRELAQERISRLSLEPGLADDAPCHIAGGAIRGGAINWPVLGAACVIPRAETELAEVQIILSDLKKNYGGPAGSTSLEKWLDLENIPSVDATINKKLGEGQHGIVFGAIVNGKPRALKAAKYSDTDLRKLDGSLDELLRELSVSEDLCSTVSIPCGKTYGLVKIEDVPYLMSDEIIGTHSKDLTPQQIIDLFEADTVESQTRIQKIRNDLKNAIETGWNPRDFQFMVLSEPQTFRGIDYKEGDVIFTDFSRWEKRAEPVTGKQIDGIIEREIENGIYADDATTALAPADESGVRQIESVPAVTPLKREESLDEIVESAAVYKGKDSKGRDAFFLEGEEYYETAEGNLRRKRTPIWDERISREQNSEIYGEIDKAKVQENLPRRIEDTTLEWKDAISGDNLDDLIKQVEDTGQPVTIAEGIFHTTKKSKFLFIPTTEVVEGVQSFKYYPGGSYAMEITNPNTGESIASHYYSIEGSEMEIVLTFVAPNYQGVGVNRRLLLQSRELHPEVEQVKGFLTGTNKDPYIKYLRNNPGATPTEAIKEVPAYKIMEKAGWELDAEKSSLPTLEELDSLDETVNKDLVIISNKKPLPEDVSSPTGSFAGLDVIDNDLEQAIS
jgi:predicted Ser/Thr protein kinase